jgi:hypothetical protein
MSNTLNINPSHPSGFEDRYRLYIDESGDHVFKDTDQIPHRYLCLLGCWFKNPNYLQFHDDLEELKKKHFNQHPDDPVILHREDIINKRGVFKVLQNKQRREYFDSDLLATIQRAEFLAFAVVIDKALLHELYGDTAAHPYHLGLGFLLQRYAGYLNHINRIGDVLAEARGGKEDHLLEESYTRVYEHGIWSVTSSEYFQSALSSRQLKFREKKANIAGLQLSDLLGHPTKMWVLQRYGLIQDNPTEFAIRLMKIVENKFNKQLYTNRLDGYGFRVYPFK